MPVHMNVPSSQFDVTRVIQVVARVCHALGAFSSTKEKLLRVAEYLSKDHLFRALRTQLA